MKERPILFSAPMVRAILDGSKTQTRRIVKQQPLESARDAGVISAPGQSYDAEWSWLDSTDLMEAGIVGDDFRCPYGQPGDRLWVRETHRPILGQTCGLINVDYRADPREKWERLGDQIGTPSRWIPSIHMRREYSRITLEIISVRVERLNDCSEADAQAEGARECDFATGREIILAGAGASQRGSYVLHYRHIWESINGSRSWTANPWVWVVEFRRLQ